MDFKNKELNQSYWDAFYKSNVIDVPSQFCAFVATDIEKGKAIIEFGSGNGRDSLYFASQGFEVVAIDLSEEAVHHCNTSAKSRKIEHASFTCGDLSVDQDIQAAFKRARGKSEEGVIIYSRFVMHSLDDAQETEFLTSLSNNLKAGDKVYFEFRSSEDQALSKHFGGHYRRYINIDDFCTTLSKQHNLTIDYCITGQGMAKFKEEDPFVSRIIAIK